MGQAAEYPYFSESSLRNAGTCYNSNRLSSKIQPLAKRPARTLLRTCATVAAPPQQAEAKKAMVAAPPQACSAAALWHMARTSHNPSRCCGHIAELGVNVYDALVLPSCAGHSCSLPDCWMSRQVAAGLQATYRKDYKPTAYLIDKVYLDFALHEDKTRVKSTLSMVPNYDGGKPPELSLDGERPWLHANTPCLETKATLEWQLQDNVCHCRLPCLHKTNCCTHTPILQLFVCSADAEQAGRMRGVVLISRG